MMNPKSIHQVQQPQFQKIPPQNAPQSHDVVQNPGTSRIIPKETDVIFGRGHAESKNPGNSRFYAIIDSILSQYEETDSKREKSFLVEWVYGKVLEKSSFAMMEQGSDHCYEATKSQAKSKIGHAIRYRLKQRKSPPFKEPKSLAGRARKKASKIPKRITQVVEDLFTDEEMESVLDCPDFFDLPNPVPDLDWLDAISTLF